MGKRDELNELAMVAGRTPSAEHDRPQIALFLNSQEYGALLARAENI